MQAGEQWWLSEVLPAMKMAVPVGINNIPYENAKKTLENITTKNRTEADGAPKELSIEVMNELSDIVYNIIYGCVENNKRHKSK